MVKKAAPKRPPSPRKRRTADEARTAILDAAERMLIAAGPAGIRLQQVATEVGVSHPTVLHHFGSREKLVEAVVARATASVRARLVDAVRSPASDDPDQVRHLLDGVFDALAGRGTGRAFLWLALEGYGPRFDALQVREIADAVDDVRREHRRAKGKRPPSSEDTYFTVLLPALALLSLSVLDHGGTAAQDPDQPKRFRAWLARLIHAHLDEG